MRIRVLGRVPDWVWATLVLLLMVAVCLTMAWFFRAAMVGASDGQSVEANIETVAGVYLTRDGETRGWANVPFEVEVVGETLTVTPHI
jgi:hypothetical protein